MAIAVDLTEMADYQLRTLGDELRDIGDFFGIGLNSREMEKLTRSSASSLSRVLNGSERSLREMPHISVVAAFSRTAKAILEERVPPGMTFSPAGMRSWLHSGSLLTRDGCRVPIDVLSDTDLARDALNALREQNGQ